MDSAEEIFIAVEVLIKLQLAMHLTHKERNSLCVAAEKCLDALRVDLQYGEDFRRLGSPNSKNEIPF